MLLTEREQVFQRELINADVISAASWERCQKQNLNSLFEILLENETQMDMDRWFIHLIRKYSFIRVKDVIWSETLWDELSIPSDQAHWMSKNYYVPVGRLGNTLQIATFFPESLLKSANSTFFDIMTFNKVFLAISPSEAKTMARSFEEKRKRSELYNTA